MLHTSARVCSIQNDISREHVRFLTCQGSPRVWGPFLETSSSVTPRSGPLDPDLAPRFKGKYCSGTPVPETQFFLSYGCIVEGWPPSQHVLRDNLSQDAVIGAEGDFALLAQGKSPTRQSFEHMSVGSTRFNKNRCSSTGVLHSGALVHRFNRVKGYPRGVYL